MRSDQPRILVTRTDRLGDVLLALPALELIRNVFPDASIDFLAQSDPMDAVDPYLHSRSINAIRFDPANDAAAVARLTDRQYSAALYLFAPTSILALGWRMRIRWRVGNKLKPMSFVLLNRGVRQRRTDGGGHEVRYNLELASNLMALLGRPDVPPTAPPIVIPTDSDSAVAADDLLAKAGFGPGARFVVFHPGMGGSALNLPASQWISVMDHVQSTTPYPQVMSIGPASHDREIVDAIRTQRPEIPLLPQMSVSVLREVFRRADLVVGPSTGPMHLAHYVGTRTIGFFAPVRSMRPERWGPAGGMAETITLTPEVPCPAARICLGPRCQYFNCMARAPWVEFLDKRDKADTLLRAESNAAQQGPPADTLIGSP